MNISKDELERLVKDAFVSGYTLALTRRAKRARDVAENDYGDWRDHGPGYVMMDLVNDREKSDGFQAYLDASAECEDTLTTVCIQHHRFWPCRHGSEVWPCQTSTAEWDVERVRQYQQGTGVSAVDAYTGRIICGVHGQQWPCPHLGLKPKLRSCTAIPQPRPPAGGSGEAKAN